MIAAALLVAMFAFSTCVQVVSALVRACLPRPKTWVERHTIDEDNQLVVLKSKDGIHFVGHLSRHPEPRPDGDQEPDWWKVIRNRRN